MLYKCCNIYKMHTRKLRNILILVQAILSYIIYLPIMCVQTPPAQYFDESLIKVEVITHHE